MSISATVTSSHRQTTVSAVEARRARPAAPGTPRASPPRIGAARPRDSSTRGCVRAAGAPAVAAPAPALRRLELPRRRRCVPRSTASCAPPMPVISPAAKTRGFEVACSVIDDDGKGLIGRHLHAAAGGDRQLGLGAEAVADGQDVDGDPSLGARSRPTRDGRAATTVTASSRSAPWAATTIERLCGPHAVAEQGGDVARGLADAAADSRSGRAGGAASAAGGWPRARRPRWRRGRRARRRREAGTVRCRRRAPADRRRRRCP